MTKVGGYTGEGVKRTSDLLMAFKHHIPSEEEWEVLHRAVNLLEKWIAEGKPWSFSISYKP